MAAAARREGIEFVVGEEKGVRDLLAEAEVRPLFVAALQAGVLRVELADASGQTICSLGDGGPQPAARLTAPLTLEGEEIGRVVIEVARVREAAFQGFIGLMGAAVQTLLTNNLKRMLTTEIHTTVVTTSYEELLVANKELSLSEARYRALAEQLERKVEERGQELQRAMSQLLQKEKLAAVGQLAAGLAHEINNPLGFVASNLHTLTKYAATLTEMLTGYQAVLAAAQVDGQGRTRLEGEAKRLKLDFILADLMPLLEQSKAGCQRVAKIVADLKGFSHIDQSEHVEVDLNQEIDRTLSVLAHHIPADATIVKRYGVLSSLSCRAGELCQAFLNIVQNAIQARPNGLRLTIESREAEGRIALLFADNGPGIAPEAIGRIFEPFFTTKEVGSGMGMGLAIAHDAVTAAGGTIEAKSWPGTGTTIVITLPLQAAKPSL